MNTLNTHFIYQALEIEVQGHYVDIQRVVIDSRIVQQGDLFVAIKGKNLDGHDYVDVALAAGAVLCLVDREDYRHHQNCIYVTDTIKALGQLAACWRQIVNPNLQVIAITGSSGKTTVKEMVTSILQHTLGSESVLATQGNFNNHIGLPLTLLQLQSHHQFAVIEMGMNHLGELDYLTHLARPNYALVNNVLRAHIGCGFSGTEDIARAKSEIYHGMMPDGIALIPIDDQYADLFQMVSAHVQQRTFGLHHGLVHATDIDLNARFSTFRLMTPQGNIPINLPTPGLHNVYNAIAASAVTTACGVDLNHIEAGLAEFGNIKGRLQIRQGIKDSLILDDTYNANPDSMKAAIDVLAIQPQPRVLVMGDMGELGVDSRKMHEEVGQYALDKGIKDVYFVGQDSRFAAIVYGREDRWFDDKDSLITCLSSQLPDAASILVKGSRFMRMEDVVSALVK